jgi:hypothetical protein
MKFSIKVKPVKKIFAVIFISSFIAAILVAAEGCRIGSAKAGDDCFVCHEDKDLYMERDGKKISLYVSPELYKKSVHNIAECTDCHTGYNPDEIPHSKNTVKVDCISCHGDNKLKELQSSIHSKVKCYDCHTKHEVKPVKEFAKNQSESCIKCHRTKNIQRYKTSVHSTNNVGCDACHKGGHNVKKFNKSETADMCGKCHGQHERNFNNSVHQTVLTKGNTKAPTCTDCHGSHQILLSKISIESQACLKCHLDEKLFPGESKGSAKFITEYRTSIHASIEKGGNEAAGCTDCHGNHMIQQTSDPGSSTVRARQVETCGKCHQDITAQYKKSQHGIELTKHNVVAPVCSDCHGEHGIKSYKKSDEKWKISEVEMCLKCHREQKLPHINYKNEEVLISNYKDSYHYKALLEGNYNSATCSDCHGSHEMTKVDNPESKMHKKNIPQTCGQANCHTKQLFEFTGSIHEVSLTLKSSVDAPNCTSCHGNHQIVKKDDKGNIISNPKGLVQLCSSCHNSVELAEKYNMPVGRTESFRESFHGLAIRGGSKVAANCESCHGYHNIRPSDDSLSTIYQKNLPVTCGKCHPGAVDAFFMTPIHITDAEKETPGVYWVTRIYILLIFSVIGGMVVHNVLDFVKKFKVRSKKK